MHFSATVSTMHKTIEYHKKVTLNPFTLLKAIWLPFELPPPLKLITSTDKCPSEFLLLLSLKGHYQRRSEHIFSAVMLQMLNLPRKWKTELIPLEEKKRTAKTTIYTSYSTNHICILWPFQRKSLISNLWSQSCGKQNSTLLPLAGFLSSFLIKGIRK